MMIYRSCNTASNDEVRKEFVHNCATVLHSIRKDWVTRNGGWVGAYIDAAEDQAMKNFIGLSRKEVASIATAVKVCCAGVGLFAVSKLVQSIAFSPNTPRPM
jgi:hypothetical protein